MRSLLIKYKFMALAEFVALALFAVHKALGHSTSPANHPASHARKVHALTAPGH